MLNNYFLISSHVFIYLECDKVLLYSKLGILKIKNKLLKKFLILNNILLSNLSDIRTFFIRKIVLLISNSYTSKFKIVGVGYRQFYSNNIVVYKLRYSHLIYNVLPLEILTFKKHKKKKYFRIYSLNKININKILQMWLFYRIPNVYTKKGFLKKNQQYHFKKMKQNII